MGKSRDFALEYAQQSSIRVGQSSIEVALPHNVPSTSSWCHPGGSCKHLLFMAITHILVRECMVFLASGRMHMTVSARTIL